MALRDALEASGRPSTLARFAVGAMAVSVAIEVAAFAVVAAAAWLADNGADSAAIVALDAVPTVGPLFGAVGVSVLSASLAMLASGLFRKWLCWFGIVSGSFTIVGGIIEPARAGATEAFHDLGQIPLAIGVPTFWIWMLATSIILWRHAPKRRVRKGTV